MADAERQVDSNGTPLVSGEWLGPNVHVCYGWDCKRVREWMEKNPGRDPHDESIFCWGCEDCS